MFAVRPHQGPEIYEVRRLLSSISARRTAVYAAEVVTGTLLAWLQSYLEGRTQFFKLSVTSCGTQGSGLSCVIMIILMHFYTTIRAWRTFSRTSKKQARCVTVTSRRTLLFGPVGDVITEHAWCSLPPIRRWHVAPPRHECRQHCCWTVYSCCMYLRRQTVLPTERPAAQPGQVGGSSRRHCESAVRHRLMNPHHQYPSLMWIFR